MAQMVKNLPAMQVTWVWSLGQEDPLEKGMATHSNILPWRIWKTDEPGRLWSVKSQRVRHDWATNTFTFRFFVHPEEKIQMLRKDSKWHSGVVPFWLPHCKCQLSLPQCWGEGQACIIHLHSVLGDGDRLLECTEKWGQAWEFKTSPK